MPWSFRFGGYTTQARQEREGRKLGIAVRDEKGRVNMKLTSKAQKIIVDQGGSVVVGLEEHVCYNWGGAQARAIPSVRWGTPELSELSQYKKMNLDGADVYVHQAIQCTAGARIDAVTGKVGPKLIFLGFIGSGK